MLQNGRKTEDSTKRVQSSSQNELNHLLNNNIETIEKRDDAASLELNLTNHNQDDLIERLCNKNTKYREIINLIDKAPKCSDTINCNTDETTENIINMFQPKPNSLQAKMARSKFCFLYNEISSMCTGTRPPSGNRMKTPFNYRDAYQVKAPLPEAKPFAIRNVSKDSEFELKGENRTLPSKRSLSTLKLPVKGDLLELMLPRNRCYSPSPLNRNDINFKKIYTLPSLMLNKKNYIASFSNDYYESELDKFSSRLNQKSTRSCFTSTKAQELHHNFTFMRKYDNLTHKRPKKTLFALLQP